MRGLAAIGRARQGSGYITAADARTEGTTLAFIRRHLPKAIFPSSSSERLRARPIDPYSHLVEIVTDSGAQIVTAHGSRERELAGQHRAIYFGVLEKKLPASALKRFYGKTVGGLKLLGNPERLFELARGGELDNLGALYVSPEVST